MEAVIIGAGSSGVLHALAFRAAKVKVAAVYDPDRVRAEALADLAQARVVDSFESAVSVDASVAAVCSPPALHVAQAEALARGGRTVFVEKPVATSELDLGRLRALPTCIPIVQWRAGRAIRTLRRAIAHGELGPAPVVSLDLAWGRGDEYFEARRSTWGCGAILSIGIHAIDAVAWALGRPIEAASGMTTKRDGEAHETAAVALLRFAGGAMASLRISLDGGGDATRIAFCGRGVSASITGAEADPTASRITWSALDPRTRDRLEALERDTPGALGPPLLVPYLGRAVEALRDGEVPGASDRLPSIADVASSHAAAICIAQCARL